MKSLLQVSDRQQSLKNVPPNYLLKSPRNLCKKMYSFLVSSRLHWTAAKVKANAHNYTPLQHAVGQAKWTFQEKGWVAR
jgi:hypothetical protein